MTTVPRPHGSTRPGARLLWLLPAVFAAGCYSTGASTDDATSILSALNTQPTPMEAAIWAQDEFNADRRFRGTRLLASAPWGGAEVYVKLYRLRIEDEDAAVRAVAARALGAHGLPEDAALIVPLLQDDDTFARVEAARALQRLHYPPATSALVRVLDPARESNADIRAEAAIALGQYADQSVVLQLIESLDDESFRVSEAAHWSLRTLTGQRFSDRRELWATWYRWSSSPFAEQQAYYYPVFQRGNAWYEYIPFVPPPPNEVASRPAGVEDRAEGAGGGG